ncbi:MAG: fumarylacetoacetate hydrolase [Sporomusa sp.]|jgi:2-keto-4-pentenoate hydratase/2-oxohepta-3-ene-1,7-dioic acid hydratase in catechol pathway|nr:fumarylacetoacetate hydrolase [Sporomusa sp.]
MRLATIKLDGSEVAAIVTVAGVVPIHELNRVIGKNWSTDMLEIIKSGQLEEIKAWYLAGGKAQVEALGEYTIAKEAAIFAPLYRQPSKIWGIGLNYVDHAGDLAEKAPSVAPASFCKFNTTIIGPGDEIKIPVQSQKTTGEAELAVIYGKQCKDIEEKDWLSVVAGFTTVIDMTAEDLLRINPRYLTFTKNFDTFFSLGSILVTPDEIEDVMKLKVATVINGEVYAQNVVSNMTFPPDYLVSFHSKVATMLPGDIISTGTPRAVHINDGDVVECRIDGFEPIANPVVDLKVKK